MKIIVPLRPRSAAELEMILPQLDKRVDIIEIWLDYVVQERMFAPSLIPHIQHLLEEAKTEFKVELLGVCKTPAEQGSFPGSSHERVQVLQQWLQLGGDWVDVDITQNSTELIQTLPAEKLWLSFHHFSAVPDNLDKILQQMQALKPAVYKFAVTPDVEPDLERFLSFAEGAKDPTIFTTMGELGAAGREQLKPHTWGAFYALSPEYSTASGQPTIADLPKT